MGYCTGRFAFAGTGTQVIATGLTGAPTWCRVTIADSGSNNISVGTSDGTRQNVEATNVGSFNTKIMALKNGSGTTIGDAAWSSFGTSGGSGTVTFNVITVPGTLEGVLEVGN